MRSVDWYVVCKYFKTLIFAFFILFLSLFLPIAISVSSVCFVASNIPGAEEPDHQMC